MREVRGLNQSSRAEIRARVMVGEDPTVVTPPPGGKWMCIVCERVYGCGLSISHTVTCHRCMVSLEQEREFDTRRRG